MTIAPLEKIYWSDIEEACLTFIKTKCCNIDEMSSTMDEDFIYGNSLSYTGYTDATTVMPYHDVTVTFTNNDTVCQVVTSETVRQQLRSFIDIHLGSLGSLGFINVSTYASILNLYTYIAGFISAKLLLIRHPFKSSDGYVFYDSNHMAGANYGQVRVSSQLSSSDMLTYLTDTFNNSSYGDATGAQGSGRIPARAMLLTMSNECVTTGYPSGYAAYESSTPGTYTFNVAQSGVYDIHLVGGGGGGYRGAWAEGGHWLWTSAGGGSGAYVHWWQYLTAGAYSVTVGAAGSSSSSYGVSAGNGGNTVFLSQTAGGGIGGHGGGYYPVGGSGGTYSTSYTGTNGNPGDTSGMAGTANGGSSVYSGYGAGGNGAPSAGNNGAIVLFYRDAVAPIIFESSSPGTYTLNITRAGNYEVTVIGAGSGSAAGSDKAKYSGKSRLAAGGSGAAVVTIYNLAVGSYIITVGAGGAGSGTGMWTWNDGGAGGSSSFSNYITCTGGGATHSAWSDWSGQYGGAAGTVSVLTGYSSIGFQSNGIAGTVYGGYGDFSGAASVYGGYGKGGDGGSNSNGGWTQAGGNGYVCVRQLAGVD